MPNPLPFGWGRATLPKILELIALTEPGPFAGKTIELGEYYGVFDGERLIAMAGERFIAGPLREISGVCTHPEFQGRGLARHLIEKLIRLELQRQEIPFLHVKRDNVRARRIYEKWVSATIKSGCCTWSRENKARSFQLLSRRGPTRP